VERNRKAGQNQPGVVGPIEEEEEEEEQGPWFSKICFTKMLSVCISFHNISSKKRSN
jgi:hypothetical protein